MEHTTDELLTNAFRNRVQNLKSQDTTSTADHIVRIAILSVIAIAKWTALSTLAWLGWKEISQTFGASPLTFFQVMLILGAARSVTMLLIDPIINTFSKSSKD